jgi:hypothetical protein
MLPAAAAAAPLSAKIADKLHADSVRVRISAVVAASKSGADNARSLLEAKLRDDKAAPVRAAAVEGLERIGDPAALAAVRKARKDKSALVRRLAERAVTVLQAKKKAGLRRSPSSQGPAVPIDLSDVTDLSGGQYGDVASALRAQVKAGIESDSRRAWKVSTSPLRKGYGLITRVRAIKPFSQGGVNGLEVRCEMTVVKLPGKQLRLSLRANAAAGVQGELREQSKPGLVRDGIKACAPALAKDFVDYAFARPPP